jgi:hypothetical protein
MSRAIGLLLRDGIRRRLFFLFELGSLPYFSSAARFRSYCALGLFDLGLVCSSLLAQLLRSLCTDSFSPASAR